ncbi:hypothetical protein K432DRAFT_285796 [Lepidopterella palustris CBS 459.81]|uniref:Uncharacterized protein n=1 Tax=Lepidopterella palustris CBS 459.81 TaxID=1314670 RepID=A0A8E2EL31_9PEZI|nr:hypothetical protein K432DRAFT_285796 [Lepidopterella palustris CBS 459.81]
MLFTHFPVLFAPAIFTSIFTSIAFADPNSVCNSFGIDFLDGNEYFINTNSNDSFTVVSEFEGCNADVADIMLVLPSGDELICSEVNTTPDDTPEMSTCPILKDQMVTGEYLILILGNNGDGNPFAYERDITLDCGPQATSTVTPTVTWNVTVTPTDTSTIWSTVTNTSTTGPFTTYTVPSKTRTRTITPSDVYTTITRTRTRHANTWTKIQNIITSTVTASCSVPPKPQRPDKRCTYTPTLLHPKALATPTSKRSRAIRVADRRAVDINYARRRFTEAKLRRDAKVKAVVEERAPDAPTVYVTYSIPINVTSTVTAPDVTTTETDFTTIVTTTTLPPSTVYSGISTTYTTLPTKTETRHTVTYTTISVTHTIYATWTLTKTVTPSASVTACSRKGGHFPGRW